MLAVCLVSTAHGIHGTLPLKSRIAGEDALANLSIEKTEAGNITGHVRIRSKTQGIALSLGDRITTSQKDGKPPV